MKNKQQFINAAEAIMAYRGCTLGQAEAILEQDEWINVSCAYNDGQQDALNDASLVIRQMFDEAKEQAKKEHKRALADNPFFKD